VLLTIIAEVFAGPLARLQDKPEVVTALRYLAPSAPFAALILVFIAATMAAKVLRFNLYVRGLAQPGLLALVALPVGYLAGPSLLNLCLSHLGATIAAALLAWLAAGRVFSHLPLRRALLRGPPHWELVRFSLPMGLSEFFNALLRRVDIILLSVYVDERALGVYAAAELISRVVANARYAFDPVVAPIFAEALRQKDAARLAYNLKLMTRWVGLLTFPIVAAVSGFRHDLLLLFGPEYTAAGGVLVVLLAGHLLNGVVGLTGWVIPMSGRSHLVLLNNVVSVVVNVVLCLWLLPRYQLMGAAIAVGGAVVVVQLLFCLQTFHLERVHAFSWGFFKVLVAGGVTLAAMVALGPRLPGPIILRLIYGTLGMLIAYGVLLAILGLGAEEKDIIRRQLARLRRKR
ncbi:MAG: oligosaccharide flippase family protein, partial [Deltaproteobacteria bacterium]|nr:oligosaccharide flippase family protein [Deltaproteobacteria bacterium]